MTMNNTRTEENTTIEYIKRNRTKLIQLSLILVLSYPLIFPIGLPIVISDHPIAFFNYVNELEPGSKVLFSFDLGAGSLGETLGGAIAFLHQAMDKGLKLYVVGVFTVDGVVMVWDKYALTEVIPSDYGYEYGIDYVNMGFIPGASVGMDAFARDILKTLPYDNYGTPLEDIPMMEGITTINDFDLIVGSDYPQTIAQQWVVPFNIPFIQLGHQGQITRDLEPLYSAGVLDEYIAGAIHGAEYETLLDKPGRALSMQDSLSLGQLLIISFLLINNVWYLTHREVVK